MTNHYSHQAFDEDDFRAVLEALKSDFITQGERVNYFEKEIAKYVGAAYAVVFNSATSALNIAYKILGEKGDRFLTTPISFCATSNMMLENNIEPIFCDINHLGNINLDSIIKNLGSNENRKIKAIVSVDYAGNSVEALKIKEICKKFNLYFISDSAHSFGGEYNGIKIGGFADITIFSFHALKPITTIEGGAIVTNNFDFYTKAKLLRSHGMVKNTPWDGELSCLGHNFRLSDVASALGISQLKKLPSFLEKRAKLAKIYNENFKNNNYFTFLNIPSNIKSTHHLYPIFLHERFFESKPKILQALLDSNIGVQVHYKPIYQFKLYKNYKPVENMENVDNFYNAEISLPLHQLLSIEDINYISTRLFEVLKKYL